MKSNKIIMLVGGTDCTGGAGLPADISTVRMLQCYPMPVVSCITSQGPDGFRMMQPASLDIFSDQLQSVLSNVRPDAVKIGMLPSARHMEILTLMLARYDHGPVVFDPIMAPTDGSGNFSADWIEDQGCLAAFLSQVDMITPNLPELRRLAEPIQQGNLVPVPEGIPLPDGKLLQMIIDMHLVRAMYDLGCVLLTGGHNDDNRYTDILMHSIDDPSELEEIGPDISFEADCSSESENDDEPDFSNDIPDLDHEDDDDDDDEGFGADDDADISDDTPHMESIHYNIGIISGEEIDTPNTHGTGCVYSTAIATLLGQDLKMHMAVSLAKKLMTMLLEFGKDWRLFDSGHGPAFSVLNISGNAPGGMSQLSDFGPNGIMN